MKITYNWLKKYIDVPYTSEELADKLTTAGIEVEEVSIANIIPEGIVVAEILERKPHPNADKLSICNVSTGKEELQIVCGAPNCDVGLKTSLATIGTVFINEKIGEKFKIKKSKLRGVESYGMLCSATELGLSEDHRGIMEFSKDTPVGIPVSSLIEADTVYDLEITPNRPDWLSVIGIVREIWALSGNEMRNLGIVVPGATKDKDYSNLIEVQDYALCPKYTGRVIRGVTVKESPTWMKEILISIGLRPINNIVDISNFVLFETGQPLHVFDLDELEENRIIVRRAGLNEKIVALNGIEYKLSNDNLVIADAAKPICIAGIMGGEHSAVTEKTKNILIESAYFNPANIRATSRKFNLSSDSSYRFERGIDVGMVCAASDRAAILILKYGGGTLCSEIINAKDDSNIPKPKTVVCCFDNIRNLLGIDISDDRIIDIFRKLGLGVKNITKKKCDVTATSFRLDIEREADLAEEVIRIYGLSKIPVVEVKALPGGSIKKDAYTTLSAARDELISLGLTECINYTLIDRKTILKDSRFKKEDLLEVINPISSDGSAMRPSLLFGVLKNLERNISHNLHDLKLFEIGTVYSADKKVHPEERKNSCIVITGRKYPERYSKEKTVEYDFYDMKGFLESWFAMRKIKNYSVTKTENPVFKPGFGADFILNGKSVISFGEIAEDFTKGIRLKYPVYVALVELDKILNTQIPVIPYQLVTQFPAITRDVAVIVDESIENSLIVDCIKRAKCKMLENIEILDIYLDESIGKNKKSIAYTLTFRNPVTTLTDKEVNKAHEMIRAKLLKELPLTLR
jgi:phenylalanyl-tRNA synthetase beta chain